jgi:hypothetical protein
LIGSGSDNWHGIGKNSCQSLLFLKKGDDYNMKESANQTNAVYGLGLIGAAVYYISQATTFWMGVLGFLKAIVWPALLVYESLKHFGM